VAEQAELGSVGRCTGTEATVISWNTGGPGFLKRRKIRNKKKI